MPSTPRRQVAQGGADLATWRRQFDGVTAIASLEARQLGRCVGVVRAIRFNPGTHFELIVEDDTGRLRARWHRAVPLRGVELGAAVRLEGAVAADADGVPLLHNPEWAIVAEPYA